MDDGADAGAPTPAQQQREPDLSVLWPYGRILTSVTCGACDSNKEVRLVDHDPLYGWRWLLWFAAGCLVGLAIVKATLI